MASGYDASRLDMGRLRDYAAKVARSTTAALSIPVFQQRHQSVQVRRERKKGWFGGTETYFETEMRTSHLKLLDEHWQLLRLVGNQEETNYPRKVQEYHEEMIWALLPDGSLHYVRIWDEFTKYENTAGQFEYGASAEPMTEEKVLELDHDHPYYEHHDGRAGVHWWGELHTGRRRAHARGVGLSLALKKLLDTK